jgi:predicted peptidase
MNRRETIRLLGSASAGVLFRDVAKATRSLATALTEDVTPPLAPGTPMSPERIALIDAFQKESAGIENAFEARTHKGAWTMPYRLFRPTASSKVPLVLYLHGSGGLGDDNVKQMAFGNIFGTRVWALPQNQRMFPCFVVAPQTDRGWVHYDLSQQTTGPAKVLPGLGDGSRMALEIVDALRRELPIEEHRIYVTGQSMGGAGAWNVLTYRPQFFAAAVICCGSVSLEDGTGSVDTPLWAAHGDSDKTVPVAVSRDRIAARRKAGGRPLYSEYAGVDHEVWRWTFTEPELVKWVFSQHGS